MESSEQFSFGDFSDLQVEDYEKICQILHGRKDGIKHVEFPWDTGKEGWAVPQADDGARYNQNDIAETRQMPPMAIPRFVPVNGMPPIPPMVPVGTYPMGVPLGQVPHGQMARVMHYPQYCHPPAELLQPNLCDGHYRADVPAKCNSYESENCELRDVVVDAASKPHGQQQPKTAGNYSNVPQPSAERKVDSAVNRAVNEEKPANTENKKVVDENKIVEENENVSERTTVKSNLPPENAESSINKSGQPQDKAAATAVTTTTITTTPVTCSTEDSVAFGKDDPPLPSHGATSRNSESTTPGGAQVQSWAALFKNEKTANDAKVTYIGAGDSNKEGSPPITTSKKPETVELPVPVSQDSAASKLGDFLRNVKLDHRVIALQPRGLVNRGNWCYINATLQALVACPPFYHLLKQLSTASLLTRGPSSTPILDSFVDFVKKFSPMTRSSGSRNKRNAELVPGSPFEPDKIYQMLQVIQANHCFKLGKQEDAEEFLSCILDGLHEEMAAAISAVTNNTPVNGMAQPNGFIEDEEVDEEDEESWQQVGPKKKSVHTRRATFAKTPIGDIFAGQIRSAVYKSTAAVESATLQPFFTLQLDIQNENIWTVCDALDGLVCKEQVHGYTCPKTKEEVEAARKITLEELPSVLILHLKCFVYDQKGGCQKLLKKIDFEVSLQIKKEMLSATAKSKVQAAHRTYKLFAVVFHHGKNATGGHYTTNVYHPGINSWVQIDDSRIQTVSVEQVLKFASPRMPYLLYYRRIDLA